MTFLSWPRAALAQLCIPQEVGNSESLEILRDLQEVSRVPRHSLMALIKRFINLFLGNTEVPWNYLDK